MKHTIKTIFSMKLKKEKITALTAYDFLTAKFLDESGIIRAPTLTLYKEPVHPTWGSEQGKLYLFSLPPAIAGAPIKAWLNFLSGLL